MDLNSFYMSRFEVNKYKKLSDNFPMRVTAPTYPFLTRFRYTIPNTIATRASMPL